MKETAGKLKRVAIIGGGPSALFLYKRLLETGRSDFAIDIFEAKPYLGKGMPYSCAGANAEHITNVSGNEIPVLETTFMEWLATVPQERLSHFEIDKERFNEFMVFPRLLFGEYLEHQFELLQHKAKLCGIPTHVHLNSTVTDITDVVADNRVIVELACGERLSFDKVMICTGHKWPLINEGKKDGYFDSPYPPSKLSLQSDHAIAIRGSSLTAIDAIRTLARCNGVFIKTVSDGLTYKAHDHATDFRIIMHSRQGLLPGIRFHLDDPRLSKNSLLTKKDIDTHIAENDGFLSLDFIFEKDFKEPFKKKDPDFYVFIKDMSMEGFVHTMMNMREHVEPFVLFKTEYEEAKKSIRRKESVYWKEMLAVLSFAMNYPAKHFSAEDMLRLHHTLMPLISIVIAFVPQSSCDEVIALHNAGKLELISVGEESKVDYQSDGEISYHYTDDSGKPHHKSYKTFIDCIGQRPLSLNDFPFKSLVQNETLSEARLKFRSNAEACKFRQKGNSMIDLDDRNEYYLKVPGIAITDSFRVIGKDAVSNPRIYMMAVAYISGYNPDYSGLDFCEEASKIIVEDIFGATKEKLSAS